MRVILILVDGMRADALADLPAAQVLASRSYCTFFGRTVFPSVTLPCHMSLFHSVDPERHGTTTNTFMPQVRPIEGLFDVLKRSGKRCAMFYDWEELRDLGRPGSLARSVFYSMYNYGLQTADDRLTDAFLESLTKDDMDFSFLYLGAPDEIGHRYGWMSEAYMEGISNAWRNIERVLDVVREDDFVFVTTDHGGHGRTHGTDLPEDMVVPFFMLGPGIPVGTRVEKYNIKDIAPTVCSIFDIGLPDEWEGNVLL